MTDASLLALAYRAAQASHDPSTQNGAFLADVHGHPLYETLACNEFPFGVKRDTRVQERELKYKIIVHAERSAIYKAAAAGIKTRDLKMYACWAACAECAQAIVQAGIYELVRHMPPDDPAVERWRDSVALGDQILKEGGVRILEVVDKLSGAPSILRSGELWQP